MPPSAWEFHKGGDILKDPARVRNICIIAHVDHGKTTIADSLISSNGIISSRQAGQLRYMDDRDDEQDRGITMKSSTMTLLHRFGSSIHAVNLIDSPGHVDFSSEVSTAVRLADGAIVVVDVVEGISAQTHVVLRQAWQERLQPVLVLNKIDRLISEMQFTPEEAYEHLKRIIEGVNALSSSLFAAQAFEEDAAAYDRAKDQEATGGDDEEEAKFDWEIEDKDDEDIYFDPVRGNVVFASAIDGWGFSIDQFATILAKKCGCPTKADKFEKTLWGDYYMTKEKGVGKVKKNALSKGKKALFVSAVLNVFWEIYSVVDDTPANRKAKITKFAEKLGIKVSVRDMQSADPKGPVRALLNAWMPLSRATLNMVCRCIGPPLPLNPERIQKLLYSSRPKHHYSDTVNSLESILSGETETIVTTAFVSKMVAVPLDGIPQGKSKAEELSAAERARKRQELLDRRAAEGKDQAPTASTPEHASNTSPGDTEKCNTEPTVFLLPANYNNSQPVSLDSYEDTSAGDAEQNDHVMIAITRIFSGCIKEGQKLFVLGPQYDPAKPNEYVSEGVVEKIFVLMGRDFVHVPEAPCGAVVGILGLGGQILKSATLSSTLDCPPFAGIDLVAKPLVRVALDPLSILDLPALKQGMKRLHQADPGCEVLVQNSGELVLVAAGEVHIERCVRDLREIFCPGIKFTISKPIIPLRETIVEPPKVDRLNEAIGDLNEITDTRKHYLLDSKPSDTIDSKGVVEITTSNGHWKIRVRALPLPEKITKILVTHAEKIKFFHESQLSDLSDSDRDRLTQLYDEFKCTFSETEGWVGNESAMLSFGPRQCGPNMLFSHFGGLSSAGLFSRLGICKDERESSTFTDYSATIINAFQQLCQNGPLTEEPLMGIAFELVDIVAADVGSTNDSGFLGQLVVAMKDAFKWAFLSQPVRIMTAMYNCEMMVSSTTLGKVYAVLNKRQSKILSEEMKEGTDNFVIKALVPVTHSFGFVEDIRRKSSGLASPQLLFSHWGLIYDDPFWVPTTKEEIEHFGDLADAPNPARDLVDSIRKTKGLRVEEKIVAFAEKQKTLKNK